VIDSLAWAHQRVEYVRVYTSSPIARLRWRSQSEPAGGGLVVCGIAGCYQQIDGEVLARTMIDRMAHRGPDDEGSSPTNANQISVQLAHRRLSIIDLKRRRPPAADGGGATLCYNEELYKYRTLKVELAGLGLPVLDRFRQRGRTGAWRRWGPECLKRFRGMFAFAIVDETHRWPGAGSGPAGHQALHYLARKDGVVFASELKGIVAAVSDELVADLVPCGFAPLLLGPAGPVCHPGWKSWRLERGPSSGRTARPPSPGIGISPKWRSKRPQGAGGPADGHQRVRRCPPGL